jgi:Na+-translocating ferredoxin:NAD+ oxidoreductase RnfD subunit
VSFFASPLGVYCSKNAEAEAPMTTAQASPSVTAPRAAASVFEAGRPARIPPLAVAPASRRALQRLLSDPRHFQILSLLALLLYGVWRLDLDVRPMQALVIVATALAAQLGASRIARLPSFDPRSALISALSLCLLLRSGSILVAVLTTLAAILSKFLLRWRGKHLFNPTNFGLVLFIVATGRVWVSPGQWGSVAYFAFLVLCLGGLVVNRAARSDVTIAFLASHLALTLGRASWLGQPLAIPLHQMASGGLLIFAFFMISDPKSTPDSRPGRILFAGIVATLAATIQAVLYRPNGLLLALAACAPLVPVLDALLPGGRYRWDAPRPATLRTRSVP